MLMIRISPGQQLDNGSFGTLSVLNGILSWPANMIRVAAPLFLTLAAVVLGVWALVQGRFGDASRAAVIVVAAVGLGQLLKEPVLQRPALGGGGYAQNTFPSGHVALALSAAVAVAVVLPAARSRWRALLIVLLIVVIVAGASIVSYAHRPSDVIGGELVVGAVVSAVFWGRRSAVGAYPNLILALLGSVLAGGVLVAIGALLQAAGFVLSPAVSLPGWFIVCVVPIIVVIGIVPVPISEPVRKTPVV
ncbi:MAG: phosphatase PAP2 family protein [Microbacteriaceae bacterium]|nr:MAG: phosphatase PAP2 family protein [Microbacteriaceae bacterium]